MTGKTLANLESGGYAGTCRLIRAESIKQMLQSMSIRVLISLASGIAIAGAGAGAAQTVGSAAKGTPNTATTASATGKAPVAVSTPTAGAVIGSPGATGAPTIEPVKKGGFMVPKAIVLRTLTPAETEANAVWNMRAALNVAALQCQFSNYLAAVKTYNAILKHHSDELAKAQKVMLQHFKRLDGAKSVNNFDMYTTRTYNSYSTLDAQYSFCASAGMIGKDVLATPRGKLGAIAMLRNQDIRAALGDLPLSAALAVQPMEPVMLPDVTKM